MSRSCHDSPEALKTAKENIPGTAAVIIPPWMISGSLFDYKLLWCCSHCLFSLDVSRSSHLTPSTFPWEHDLPSETTKSSPYRIVRCCMRGSKGMGVHGSTMSWTMLVQESLCEFCLSFPEAKIALNGFRKVWVDLRVKYGQKMCWITAWPFALMLDNTI